MEELREKILKLQMNNYTESDISKINKKIRKLIDELTSDNGNKQDFFFAVIESIVACKSLFIAQNIGCFKYSAISPMVVFELSKKLLALRHDLLLSDRDVQFLEGVYHIKKVFDLEMQLTKTLRSELIKATKLCKINDVQFSYVLCLCTYVEHLVLEKNATNRQTVLVDISNDVNKNSLEDFSIEEIISALGLVISEYTQIDGFRKLPVVVFADHVFTKRTKKILLLGCKIRFLQELEKSNEQFGYFCAYDDGVLRLSATPANERFLKDYRIGYIKREITESNLVSGKNRIFFIDAINSTSGLIKQERRDNPSRICLSIPDTILEKICEITELTKEEYDNVNFEAQELNLNINFFHTPMYENLSLLEYIQLRRFFLLVHHLHSVPLFEKYIKGEINKEEYIYSLIPCIDKSVFDCLRPHFGEKIDSFWKLNNYQQTGSSIIDLLYQPVISAGDKDTKYAEYFYPLCNIASISNVGRNVFVLLKRDNDKTANEDGSEDPLIKSLSNAFDAVKIKYQYDKNFRKLTDVDFAFVVENSVYIAECKKNMHPTDIFEARSMLLVQ